MMLFFFIFFLLIPKEIFGVQCTYSDESIEFQLNNFNLTDFEMQINDFPSYDYKDDNINMCRVEIYVHYKFNSLIISFGNTFEWSQLDDGEGRLDFLIMFDQTNAADSDIYNVLEYACYDSPQCNKEFVLNHIQWILQINYTIFQTHLISTLFNNSNKTEECYTDKTNFNKCSTGMCLGKYSYYHKNYLFECHKIRDGLVEVHITTNMIIITNSPNEHTIEENQIIRYTCKFNKCNHQNLTDSLIYIVEHYFSLTSMRNALLLPYKQSSYGYYGSSFQNIFQNSTTTTTTTTTTKYQQFNMANKYFFKSINLFFCFFILLFILFDIKI